MSGLEDVESRTEGCMESTLAPLVVRKLAVNNPRAMIAGNHFSSFPVLNYSNQGIKA